jgi:hypothetical protein
MPSEHGILEIRTLYFGSYLGGALILYFRDTPLLIGCYPHTKTPQKQKKQKIQNNKV